MDDGDLAVISYLKMEIKIFSERSLRSEIRRSRSWAPELRGTSSTSA